MAARNQDWYSINSTRPYPVDDASSLIDDSGHRLPSHIVVDLHLLFPESLGKYACLSSVTVTPQIVTVTLLGTNVPPVQPGCLPSDSVQASFVPMAAISIPQPVVQGRQYALDALYPGVGGWIVFGSGVEDANYAGRFSTPHQAMIMPRVGRWYRDLPVPDVAKLGHRDALTGLVLLKAGTDFEIVKECREIATVSPVAYQGCDDLNAQALDVIVFRLVDTTSSGRNVLDIYKGPCGGRPESGTCGDPEPLEFIGPVGPDCCGNITIELRGCAEVGEVVEELTLDAEGAVIDSVLACGVIVDCGLGLAEACVTRDRLPDETGKLPNEYIDMCLSVSSIAIEPTPGETDTPCGDTNSFSVEADYDPDLPYEDNFHPAPDTDPLVTKTTIEGFFVPQWPGPHYGTAAPACSGQRNSAIHDVPINTFNKWSEIDLMMLQGDPGCLHNGALLFNVKTKPTNPNRYIWYMAEIDWDGHYHGYKLFRIAKFDGSAFTTLASVAVPGLSLNMWYNIRVVISRHEDSDDSACLVARCGGGGGPSDPNNVDVVIGPLKLNGYTPSEGYFGWSASRSWVRFAQFYIVNHNGNGIPEFA